MRVEVVGKNGFYVKDVVMEYATNKLQKIDQVFAREVIDSARVVCKEYPGYYKVEITLPARSLVLRAEVSDPDIFAAIDKAVDKMLSQVRRKKDRVKNKLEKEGIKEVYRSPDAFDAIGLEKEAAASRLVKNKMIDLMPMTIEEALDQMELSGHDFYVFINKSNYKVCVAYIREDGDYAVIETQNQ